MISSRKTLQFLCVLATVLFMTIKCCNGMALKKEIIEKSSVLKEDLEKKINQTVVKVVDTKTFLLDAVAFSINKTANVMLATKQHFKETKESLKTKMSGSVNKTAHKMEELKEELHGQAKTPTNQAGRIVFVTRDFLAAPVFPMSNEIATVPFFLPSDISPTKIVPVEISNPVVSQ